MSWNQQPDKDIYVFDSKGVIGEIMERTQEHVNSVTVLLKTIEQEE